jgi:hypothetical protein
VPPPRSGTIGVSPTRRITLSGAKYPSRLEILSRCVRGVPSAWLTGRRLTPHSMPAREVVAARGTLEPLSEVMLVTGSTDGLGRALARELAA